MLTLAVLRLMGPLRKKEHESQNVINVCWPFSFLFFFLNAAKETLQEKTGAPETAIRKHPPNDKSGFSELHTQAH